MRNFKKSIKETFLLMLLVALVSLVIHKLVVNPKPALAAPAAPSLTQGVITCNGTSASIVPIEWTGTAPQEGGGYNLWRSDKTPGADSTVFYRRLPSSTTSVIDTLPSASHVWYTVQATDPNGGSPNPDANTLKVDTGCVNGSITVDSPSCTVLRGTNFCIIKDTWSTTATRVGSIGIWVSGGHFSDNGNGATLHSGYPSSSADTLHNPDGSKSLGLGPGTYNLFLNYGGTGPDPNKNFGNNVQVSANPQGPFGGTLSATPQNCVIPVGAAPDPNLGQPVCTVDVVFSTRNTLDNQSTIWISGQQFPTPTLVDGHASNPDGTPIHHPLGLVLGTYTLKQYDSSTNDESKLKNTFTVRVTQATPPPPQTCDGFQRACETPQSSDGHGTQWCKPGILDSQNQCVKIDDAHTSCVLDKDSTTPGCKPNISISSCANLAPSGIQNSGIGEGGRQTYTASDSKARNVPLTLTKNPDNATVNKPTGTTTTQSAQPLEFVGDVDHPGSWIMGIPENTSLTQDAQYIVSTTVVVTTGTQNPPGLCSFILRVPKKATSTACPSTYTSTETKFTNNLNKGPWATAATMTQGDSIFIGGFHNNSTSSFAPDTLLKITGPAGSTSRIVDLNQVNPDGSISPNYVSFTPTEPGSYTVTSTTRTSDGGIAEGQKCTGSATLTVNPPVVRTRTYKIADSPEGLATALAKLYSTEPLDIPWSLGDVTAGNQKFVWVEFTSSDGKTDRESMSIDYVGPDPTVQELTCNPDISGNGLAITLKGQNFGVNQGTITTDNGGTDILSWDNQTVSAHLNATLSPTTPNNKPFRVTLNRTDGQKITNVCALGVSQVSLGAKIFCRAPTNQTQSNLQLTIAEVTPGGQINRETVSIDQNGTILGLKSKLHQGSRYNLSIKAPKSLRKNVSFTASGGTTIIPDFILPVGDIFPLGQGDGKINSADKAELVREWSAAGGSDSTTPKDADFNQDGKVNSVDYACMRYDFGKESDPDLTPSSNVGP